MSISAKLRTYERLLRYTEQMTTTLQGKDIRTYEVKEEPFYKPVGDEVLQFQLAFENQRPVCLRGPTGCGKTALTEYMAYHLRKTVQEKNPGKEVVFPYIEIPCHEDITEAHLLGRADLVTGKWLAGPLYTAASSQYGALVVLDEFIEARPDVRVLTHSMTDDRRVLSVSRTGEVLELPESLMLVTCYNPGYQVRSKVLKPSTAQRYVTIDMNYPQAETEREIVMHKTGIEQAVAEKLVAFANEIRNAKSSDAIHLQEGASTRLVVMAAEFYASYVKRGMEPNLRAIAQVTILNPLTTEETDRKSLEELLDIL